jgi:hypothetical protein
MLAKKGVTKLKGTTLLGGCSVAQKDDAKLSRMHRSQRVHSSSERVQCSSEGCSVAKHGVE